MDVSPDAFGAGIGRGLQQVGAGVEQAQRFHDQVAADDGTNSYQSQAVRILYGDPNNQVQQPDGTLGPDTGFFGLRGDAMMRARPGVEAQLDDLEQSIRAGLTSPDSQLQFDANTRRLRSMLSERIGEQTAQQAQVWRTGVNESAAELARQHIASNPENVEELKHGLADLTMARVKEAQSVSGGDPTVMAAAAQKARAEGVATQAEALLDRNPDLARRVLENSRSILPPETYDRLVGRLRPELAGAQVDGALRDAAAPPAGVPAPTSSDATQSAPAAQSAAAPQSSASPGAPTTPTFLQGAPRPPPVAADTRLAYFDRVGASQGVSGDYLNRVFNIEGVGRNPNSSASGYFQFIPSTAARYGLANRNDFGQATAAMVRLTADNRATLTRELGRAPSDAELYLAHQQGAGGAAKLLMNPNVRAGDLVGDAAIRQNGGDPNAAASAFVSHWETAYSGRRPGNGPVPTFATPGQTPYATDSLGPAPLPQVEPMAAPSSSAPPAPMPTLLQSVPSGSQAPPAPPQMQPPGQAGSAGQPTPNPDDAVAGLPDKAAVLARAVALAGDDPIQRRMNVAEVNRRYAEQNALTATDRAELAQSLPNYMAAASAGVANVDFPERQVWRLFPPAKAREIVDEFHANQAVGSMMRGVQWASPDQLAQMQRDVASGQGVYSDALRTHRGRATTGAGTTGADPDAGGDIAFFKRQEVAGKQIAAEIDRRTRQLVGPDADPAAYVAANPTVRQAAAAVSPNDPASYGRFATASLEMQGFLGVPEAQRHVLSRGQALSVANQIAGSQDPKATLGQLAAASGSAWPQVFRDAIALGKLPAGYQAVATLDDPHDAALLARTLVGEKPGPDGKPGRSVDENVDLIAGAKGEAGRIRDAVRYDPNVKSYIASIEKSGASDEQATGIVNAVETLALAKRGAGEAADASSAASAAVKSFFGKFEYLPNGGARVPAAVFPAVSANAGVAIDGLALDRITVPPRFGQPGQPEPQEYLDTIKAAPTWITSPRSDALWLMDYAGRIVRGRDGQPVAVPFSAPAPPAPGSAASFDDIVPGL